MDAQNTQPRRQRRRGRLALWILLLGLAFLAGLSLSVWQRRIALATRVVRGALDSHGLSDASFTLVRLSPGCVILENLRLGVPEPVLTVGRIEVRFSYPEVSRGQLDRLRVTGVRTQLVIDGGRAVSPLLERLKPLLKEQAERGIARPPDASQQEQKFSVGEASVYDVQVALKLADGRDVMTLLGDASVVSEPAGGERRSERYRLWTSLRDSVGSQATVSGTVDPETGALALVPDVKIKSVEALLGRVRLIAPAPVATLAAFPTNCSLAVRGSLAVAGWTNAGPFEGVVELGRGSTFTLAKPEGFVRLQSFRIEASGTPRDVQCRLSAGLAGFRVGGQLEASQEEGRLLSVRGTARFRQTPTNRWVHATLDSDLPGRTVAQVLPRILPLVPRLFTEGGTLRGEADLSQAPQGAWQGEARFTAEARRSSVTLPAGRTGAGRAAVSGCVAIRDAQPGELRTEIVLDEGYFYRPGLSVRGGVRLALTSQPPYGSAAGTFMGQAGEFAVLPKSGITLPDGGVRFEGEASVSGLVSNPVWQIALRVPEFGISSEPASAAGSVAWHTTAGAAAELSYSATRMKIEGDAWARDTALLYVGSGVVGRVEAGLGLCSAHVHAPAFASADASNALVSVALRASNGWTRAGGHLELADAQAAAPFTWSLAGGLAFPTEPSVSWERLEAEGVRLLPGGVALQAVSGAVEARFGVRADASAFGVTASVRMPLADPRQSVIDVVLPDTELTPDDALAALVRRADAQAVVTGRLSAEARVRFMGSQPYALGRVRVSGGQVKRGALEVGGLSADVPFESGRTFRTIERPSVTFTYAKAGNIRLDQGRIEFQVTPQEVFVDRLEVGWCKGSLQAYSVHLDPKNPKADVIVYADRIDLGQALMMVMPFKGHVEGVLYGRFPVGIEDGNIKLSNGFLYSLPGQGGKLRLDDPAQMLTLLERAGIKGEVQKPLSKALSDMDFSAIRMELEPKTEGDAVFRIKLDGKSNYKEWPAPVDLNLNLHGPLERIMNLGLDVSRK